MKKLPIGSSSTLIVVDVQNCFVDGGTFTQYFDNVGECAAGDEVGFSAVFVVASGDEDRCKCAGRVFFAAPFGADEEKCVNVIDGKLLEAFDCLVLANYFVPDTAHMPRRCFTAVAIVEASSSFGGVPSMTSQRCGSDAAMAVKPA